MARLFKKKAAKGGKTAARMKAGKAGKAGVRRAGTAKKSRSSDS